MAKKMRTPARKKGGKAKSRTGSGRLWPVGGRKKQSAPLDQRTLDLIGLGLAALGVYLIFLLYIGGQGGSLGDGLRDGLFHAFGAGAYLVPPALFVAAAFMVFAPDTSIERPLRAGAALLAFGLLLLLGAGFPGGRPDGLDSFDPAWYVDHGGAVGEAFYWSLSAALQPTGAVIVAVVSIAAGLLMATGWTLGGIVSGIRRFVRNGLTAAEGLTERFDGGRERGESAEPIETELIQIEETADEVTVGLWEGEDSEAEETTSLIEPRDDEDGADPEPVTAEAELDLEPGPVEQDPLPLERVSDTTPMGETRGATVATGGSFRVPAISPAPSRQNWSRR